MRRRQGSSSRTVRRVTRHCHQPSPVVEELLGGRSPRQLTLRQRLEIADLIERGADVDVWGRAEVRAIANDTERPALRLARLLRAAKGDGHE